MKSFVLSILAIALFGYIGSCIAWWGIVLIALIVGFIAQIHGGLSFLSGFFGGALFFGAYTYYLDTMNEKILSTMMAEVLKFDPFLPTVLIGAVLGGMGMITGKYLRDSLFGEKKVVRYRGKYH